MALFDRTAKNLARGPAVLFPADAADAVSEALLRYDPALKVKDARFVFRNGVHLHGPVAVTPEIAKKAGLPDGMTTGYYASFIETGTRGSRPDDLKQQDAELLVRGVAARLGGTVHAGRLPMDVALGASVYSATALPPGRVIEVLQPHVGTGELAVDEDKNVPGAYYLVTEEEPVFFVGYWPPRLSRSKFAPPPPAVGGLGAEPSRWDLRTRYPALGAPRQACLKVGEAALALAGVAGGAVVDAYGFPVDRPEDLVGLH
jgi:hypothetical protein